MGSKRQVSKRPKTFEEQLKEAHKRTERLINVRDRSSEELRHRLLIAGFSEAVVDHEVKRALSSGLISDDRFMRLYIEGKKRNGWGQKRIEAELKRFGIEIRLHEDYPECFFSEEDEIKRAKECLARYHSTAKDQWAAQYRRLIFRGFTTDIAQKALKGTTV